MYLLLDTAWYRQYSGPLVRKGCFRVTKSALIPMGAWCSSDTAYQECAAKAAGDTRPKRQRTRDLAGWRQLWQEKSCRGRCIFLTKAFLWVPRERWQRQNQWRLQDVRWIAVLGGQRSLASCNARHTHTLSFSALLHDFCRSTAVQDEQGIAHMIADLAGHLVENS